MFYTQPQATCLKNVVERVRHENDHQPRQTVHQRWDAWMSRSTDDVDSLFIRDQIEARSGGIGGTM